MSFNLINLAAFLFTHRLYTEGLISSVKKVIKSFKSTIDNVSIQGCSIIIVLILKEFYQSDIKIIYFSIF